MRWTAIAVVLLGASALHSQTATNTGVIRGRVLAQPSDAAVRNAVVRLESNGGSVATVLTDADGRFVVTNLSSGSYGVSAEKAGFVKTAFTARVTLAGGAVAEDVEIKLPKAGAISGRILDDSGDSISGAIVAAMNPRDGTTYATETDDLGAYRLPGLPRGRFIVTITLSPGIFGPTMLAVGPGGRPMLHISAPGGRQVGIPDFRMHYYYPGVTDEARAQPIDIVPGEERAAIDVFVPIAAAVPAPDRGVGPDPRGTTTISGRITRSDGRPIARAQVRAEMTDAADVAFGTLTDNDGRYEISRLRPGRFTVTASKRGFITAEYGQRRAFERGEAIQLTASGTRTNVDIALPGQGVVAGRIVDENGDPVQGVRVQAFRITYEGGRNQLVEASAASKQTNDLGTYRVHDLEPGQYLLRASVGHVDAQRPMADIPGYAPTYFPGTAQAGQASFLSVSVAEERVGMDFGLARVPTARISGRAVTSSGLPVQGGVSMTPSARSGALALQPVAPRIAADGSFEFPNVPPGEYVI